LSILGKDSVAESASNLTLVEIPVCYFISVMGICRPENKIRGGFDF